MAYKEVSDLNADETISLGGTNTKTGKPNPTKVEGYYLGSRQVADKKKKSGLSFIYIFQTPKGNVGVWGKTDLDRKMLSVTPGYMVLASFDRMVPTPNGSMYKYKVQVDSENTIEVVGNEIAAANDDSGVESDDAQSDSYESQESSTASLVAKRKLTVQEIIANAKNKNR
jgi:hypothetical protein